MNIHDAAVSPLKKYNDLKIRNTFLIQGNIINTNK